MAARKLQAEVERTFKKVTEGIIIFESIYEKLNSSTNKALNEKIEQDLKKEIKKLQRYRDQIKTWASSNDIKDKKPLMDHRRAIEVQMERFKACEKEIKTKQYSREGLNNASRMDPREREKHDLCRWISDSVDELERQIEQAETELESVNIQSKKGKANAARVERLSELEHRIERHRWHSNKLEQALRALENGVLETDVVSGIKDDVQYYVDANQDADFAEDEAIYDDLNLGEETVSEDEDADSADDLPSPGAQAMSAPATKSPDLPKVKPVGRSKGDNATTSGNAKVSTPSKSKASAAPVAAAAGPETPPAIAGGAETDENTRRPVLLTPTLKYASAAATATNARRELNRQDRAQTGAQSAPANAVVAGPAQLIQSTPPGTPSSDHAEVRQSPKVEPFVRSLAAQRIASPARASSVDESGQSQQAHYHVPSCLTDLIPEEHALTEQERDHLLDSSMKYCPRDVHNDPPQSYVPKEPFPTPPYYPNVPLDIVSHPESIEKVEIDTLFYIFYYNRGTYQQYLASRELKKQAWRFHKRYLTWFQRHEEPKVITDEFESGTYRYFDFEASWVQRKKNDFRFQYAYLEDEST
ncbi:proteinral negative regulator of transcription subunit 5 [Savitreella phatthalungensis]